MRVEMLVLVLGSILCASAGAGVQTFTDAAHVNISGFTFFHPCANGGAGETIVVTGFLHVTVHFTLPDDGSGNFVQNYNYNQLTAVGLTTGDTYNVVGSYKFVTTYTPGDTPKTDAFKANTLFVGKGTAPNLLTHTTMQATWNANGDLTALVDFDFEKCD